MLENQVNYIREITELIPETAIILGSGLGRLAERVRDKITVSYADIPDFPVSTAPLHKGELILGYLEDKCVLLFNGRLHLYEGYTPQEAVMTVRLAKALGAKNIILTNASGVINKSFKCGDIMLISDHISCFVPSPLIGKNDDSLGVRFPDMSAVYNKNIRTLAKKIAKGLDVTLREGVYVQLTGPQFESPAEIKMLASLGADTVGMSTVIEAIAAKHSGLKVCGLSVIANYACGILDKPLTAEEVAESTEKAAPEFEMMIRGLIRTL
ncbi:MAG: purine-nucleoside phosphorylase [Eubacterium sp.]|nr:purine-nucleoside phosphorylase [Eubacterium sp.]